MCRLVLFGIHHFLFHNSPRNYFSSISLLNNTKLLFLFAELKPYDPVGPKETVEFTINMLHKREKSKAERKERNIIHVLYGHSTKH